MVCACGVGTTTASAAFSSTSASTAASSTTKCVTYNTDHARGPVVDLSYGIYAAQITTSPDTRAYYNFSNIRYAAPPVGNLRFKAPEPPVNNRSAGIQDGTYGKICPQAYTPWQNSALVTAPPGEHESEDCLFLDVVVPEEIWSQRCNASRPVIVWIHGGGFQIGAKYGTPDTNPIGLLDRSFEDDAEGAIWIGLNYRLGGFGWLQGDTFESAGGLPNVGLYDQRRALDWVQDYASLFGGDPDRVTIMGESAGGGSILHHITAYGGSHDAPPFQRAIVQSPAYVPRPYPSQAEDSFAILLENANVTSLDGLIELDTYDLQVANKQSQNTDFYGVFQFGIAPDGNYVPEMPEKLLSEGSYHKDIKLIVAHNTYEGQKYTDPAANNSSAFDKYMALYFPNASDALLQELSTQVYPAVYNGTYPWTTPFYRLMTAVSEFTFTCHAYWLGDALGAVIGQDSYSYLFSIPPGTHTLDVYFSYFVNSSSTVTNETVAKYMQGYFTSFADHGNPNRASLPTFPIYGESFTDLNLNQTFIDVVTDPAANSRCDWWKNTTYI
ncbi:Alpha/Beta hydrolase protein [Xylariales sp. AK1849]|nr:Alpha/Beta hydrolase protein [Xylariales sp. AK1849]